MNLEKLKREQNLSNEQLAEMVKAQGCPRCNKAVISMAMHSDLYGIQLVPKIGKAVREIYHPPKPKKEKPPCHKVTITIPDELYDELITKRLPFGLDLKNFILAILKEAMET